MVLAYGQVYTLEASEAPSLTYSSNSRLTDAGQVSLHGETWPPRLQHPSSCEMGRSRSLTARVGQTCWPRVTVLPGSEAEGMTASQRRTRCTQGAQVSRYIDPGTNTAAGCGHTSRRRTGRCEGSREVRDALQGLADVRLNALASMCPRMRVELRCESLDPAELKRFPTRSG